MIDTDRPFANEFLTAIRGSDLGITAYYMRLVLSAGNREALQHSGGIGTGAYLRRMVGAVDAERYHERLHGFRPNMIGYAVIRLGDALARAAAVKQAQTLHLEANQVHPLVNGHRRDGIAAAESLARLIEERHTAGQPIFAQ